MNQPEQGPNIIADAYGAAVQSGEQNDPNSLYADYMREDRVKNLIQELNPDNLVEDIEHRIRGEKKNSFTGEWEAIDKLNTKKVSELLVGRYISFLSSLLNQNTSLSNFSEREINNLMEMILDHLKYDLSDNAEDYGFVTIKEIEVERTVKRIIRKVLPNGDTQIEEVFMPLIEKKILDTYTDYNEMNRIGMIIAGTTFSVLKRALNGSEGRRIFSVFKINESLNEGKKNGGFFNNLKFWQ